MPRLSTQGVRYPVLPTHAEARPGFAAFAIASAACVMRSTTSFGCETIAAWLEATLRLFAPILFAMNSSACSGIIWSRVATMYHDGSCFHAGGPDFAVNELMLRGFCTAAMMLAST